MMMNRVATRSMRLFCPIGLAAWSISASALQKEEDHVMLSFPVAAGEATRAEAMVAFVSNGYVRGPCKVVKSSGDEFADGHACRTVSFYKTKTPLHAVTSVWVAPKFEGNFKAPVLENPGQIVNPLAYPKHDLRKGNQGTTSVKLTLDGEGNVTDCMVAQSSGYASLDRVTCKQVQRAKYQPALLEGEPVPAVVYTAMSWGAGSGPPRQ